METARAIKPVLWPFYVHVDVDQLPEWGAGGGMDLPVSPRSYRQEEEDTSCDSWSELPWSGLHLLPRDRIAPVGGG